MSANVTLLYSSGYLSVCILPQQCTKACSFLTDTIAILLTSVYFRTKYDILGRLSWIFHIIFLIVKNREDC